MILDENISELCGAILGDGHLHKTANRVVITGSLDDLEYYKNHLIPLFKKYFKIIPKLVKQKSKSSYHIVIENKKVFEFFIKDIGLKRGRKINIAVPEKIRSNPKFLKLFIRGVFDTDGYLKFSKQEIDGKNYYPRIRFSFCKTPFSLNLGDLLEELGFNYNFCIDKRNKVLCYELAGESNLDKWVKTIGISNPVHLTKYLVWKKFGSLEPNLSLEDRKKLLKETFIK